MCSITGRMHHEFHLEEALSELTELDLMRPKCASLMSIGVTWFKVKFIIVKFFFPSEVNRYFVYQLEQNKYVIYPLYVEVVNCYF